MLRLGPSGLFCLSPAIIPRLGDSPTSAVERPPKNGRSLLTNGSYCTVQHLRTHGDDVLAEAIQTLAVADT